MIWLCTLLFSAHKNKQGICKNAREGFLITDLLSVKRNKKNFLLSSFLFFLLSLF